MKVIWLFLKIYTGLPKKKLVKEIASFSTGSEAISIDDAIKGKIV